MKVIMAAFAALAVSAGAALAQSNTTLAASGCSAPNDPFRPCENVVNFDADRLLPILAELGLPAQKRFDENGTVYIAATYDNQLNFTLAPSACLDNGVSNCIGLTTFAYFSGGGFNPQTVSAFNQKYAFISAGILSGGSEAYISRYDIADFGVPRGNVRSSLGNFLNLAMRFGAELAGSGRTVSLDGFADDMASDTLNMRQLAVFGASPAAATPIEIHMQAMAALPTLVREMAADPAMPRNKIDNIQPR